MTDINDICFTKSAKHTAEWSENFGRYIIEFTTPITDLDHLETDKTGEYRTKPDNIKPIKWGIIRDNGIDWREEHPEEFDLNNLDVSDYHPWDLADIRRDKAHNEEDAIALSFLGRGWSYKNEEDYTSEEYRSILQTVYYLATNNLTLLDAYKRSGLKREDFHFGIIELLGDKIEWSDFKDNY
jgi:hypothetical protein